jgi:hypothetical protein
VRLVAAAAQHQSGGRSAHARTSGGKSWKLGACT